ncbi:MAG TPA: hypothetical protein VHG93_09910 [Longimicrobium sp.]|nr:hypothetical protein [Longimicrobium sp.]
MIFHLDHIGITVRSLEEARRGLDRLHPCFHAQSGIAPRECFTEVAMHGPQTLGISLHRKQGGMDIELMEYPRVSANAGSALPWEFDPGAPVAAVSRAAGEALARPVHACSFDRLVALLERCETLNAVLVPVPDPLAEQAFWEGLRFQPVHADRDFVVLRLRSPLPASGDRYVLLRKVDYTPRWFTDLEGVSEIALLCSSCSASLHALPAATFRTSISRLTIAGKCVDIAYVRSPAGVLVELFSVRPSS